MKCSHKDARISEDKCGYITILCDCEIPLAEITEACNCNERNPLITVGKFWGYISEDEAWAIYKREGGTQERKESKCL